MDVVLGRNVTLRTLLVKPDYMFIVWTYSNGDDQQHVATQSESGLKVNALYEGRVSVDPDTGSLFLKAAKSDDSGDFGISVISKDGETKTAEIKLRVLGESFRSVPGPRPGAPLLLSPLQHRAFHCAKVSASVLFSYFFIFLRICEILEVFKPSARLCYRIFI